MAEPAPADIDVDVGTIHRMLDFEKTVWRRAGDKVAAIKDLFGLTEIGYFQQLNGILEDPAAVAYAPVLVNRLLRLRERRYRR